jgi:hypothetical protein
MSGEGELQDVICAELRGREEALLDRALLRDCAGIAEL